MIVHISLRLMLEKNVKIRVWRGVFLSKIVYDAFKEVGIEPDFPFKVSVPEKMKPELKKGDELSFNVSFWGPDAEENASELLQALPTLQWISPLEVSLQEVEVSKPPEGSEEPVATLFVVKHGPTVYKFHGAWVPFPSPPRMIFSAFKRLSEVLDTDLSYLADEIAWKLDVVGGRPRFVRQKVHRGDEVPTFVGQVKYYGVLTEDEALKLVWASRYWKYLGLGANPSLGFGDVKGVEFREPSFKTPVKKFNPSRASS